MRTRVGGCKKVATNVGTTVVVRILVKKINEGCLGLHCGVTHTGHRVGVGTRRKGPVSRTADDLLSGVAEVPVSIRASGHCTVA